MPSGVDLERLVVNPYTADKKSFSPFMFTYKR